MAPGCKFLMGLCALMGVCVAFGPDEPVGYKQERGLVKLDDSNFHKATQRDFKKILIFFYSPRCGLCRGFMRDFRKAAEKMKSRPDNPIAFAVVNAQQSKQLMRMLQFPGVPVIRLYYDGFPIRYTGGRTAERIVEWLDSTADKPVAELRRF